MRNLLLILTTFAALTAQSSVAGVSEPTDTIQQIAKSKEDVVNGSQEINPEDICLKPDTKPAFPGGPKAMGKWIFSRLRYPQYAQQCNIQGEVVVRVIIDKKGKIVDQAVIRGVHIDLDNEAMRVVKGLPNFIPGTYNGEPVITYFDIPFTFKIRNS